MDDDCTPPCTVALLDRRNPVVHGRAHLPRCSRRPPVREREGFRVPCHRVFVPAGAGTAHASNETDDGYLMPSADSVRRANESKTRRLSEAIDNDTDDGYLMPATEHEYAQASAGSARPASPAAVEHEYAQASAGSAQSDQTDAGSNSAIRETAMDAPVVTATTCGYTGGARNCNTEVDGGEAYCKYHACPQGCGNSKSSRADLCGSCLASGTAGTTFGSVAVGQDTGAGDVFNGFALDGFGADLGENELDI